MEYAVLFLPLLGSIIGYFGRSLGNFFSELATSFFACASAFLSAAASLDSIPSFTSNSPSFTNDETISFSLTTLTTCPFINKCPLCKKTIIDKLNIRREYELKNNPIFTDVNFIKPQKY